MAQQFSFINKENYYNNKTTKRRLRYDEPVNGTTILFLIINKENYYNNKTTKRRLRHDEPVNGTTILFY